MTKKEFIIQHRAFEKGMIAAYEGILMNCKMCIKAHRKESTQKRAGEIAEMNKHLWK